ncbi:MAG: hypothetical protein V3V06_08730 [Dehalococcoidia bacterium]
MTYLVIAEGPQALSYERALRRALGPDRAVQCLAPAGADAALQRGDWDAVVLGAAGEQTATLAGLALAQGLPLLIADPIPFRAQELAAIQRTARAQAGMVTVGWVGPISPGVAALGLELAQWAGAVPPTSVLVEQQLAPIADRAFLVAVLEGVTTLAHLAGNWPARVAAVSNGTIGGGASTVMATFLSGGVTTAGLNVAVGAGAPSRRLRIVTETATLVLQEGPGGGVLSVEGEEEPLADAAGSEDRLWRPLATRRFPIAAPSPVLAVMERFLRRIREGGGDDLATLIYGLTLTERLLESAHKDGRSLSVTYRARVKESPRFQLLRGGRSSAPAPHSRPSLTIVR